MPSSEIMERLLPRLRKAMNTAFGLRFRGLILFGSEARGEATPESDIDVLILLDDLNPAADRTKVLEIIYPEMMCLPEIRIIDAIPADYAAFEAQEFPLYRAIKAEGIPA